MKYVLLVTMSLCVASCNHEDNTKTPSSGLKIFVTSKGHVGDFENDPLLEGSNSIEKADSFCNKDPNKPNDSVYKALIVDGYNRDAISLIDWVFEPDTTYYRPYNDTEIGRTLSTATIPVLYEDLTNSIAEKRSESDDGFTAPNIVYTGISDVSNFSTDGLNTCSNWSVGTNSGSANWGRIYEKTANSISTNGLVACDHIAPLYCVEQK